MKRMGLWQQGSLGPYLPLSTTFDSDGDVELVTAYLNEHYDKHPREEFGFIYISELKAFFFIQIYPKKSMDKKFKKSYTILLEMVIEDLFKAFFFQFHLETRVGTFLHNIHFLDKEGRFEDIVDEFKEAKLDQLLEVHRGFENIDINDELRLIKFKEFDAILAYLLDINHVYIINDHSENTEVLIHLLNVILSDVLDVREYLGDISFPIHIITKHDEELIKFRMQNSVVVMASSFEIKTKLKKGLHHKELEKFRSMELETRMLNMKGYYQMTITDYFHQIRSAAMGQELSKPELMPYVQRLTL